MKRQQRDVRAERGHDGQHEQAGNEHGGVDEARSPVLGRCPPHAAQRPCKREGEHIESERGEEERRITRAARDAHADCGCHTLRGRRSHGIHTEQLAATLRRDEVCRERLARRTVQRHRDTDEDSKGQQRDHGRCPPITKVAAA